ncbi:hypothetical protein GCM10025869_21250 [Homoserinibacter gongjuensis]|uniref:Uncharacterized protein n=1 Tax=Homoserinibacter gongjuensis TaxID=1162968 RepID=A0ABQ6JYC8_9MICO|nr:hypothetical protein GCM10025869_21250 [Homoserinibacter gongjuensis]
MSPSTVSANPDIRKLRNHAAARDGSAIATGTRSVRVFGLTVSRVGDGIARRSSAARHTDPCTRRVARRC